MKHIAAIFAIIYRFFSNIEYKKYARYFELALCILGILLCVRVYKSWSEVQHFYHGYSLQKLTKDNSIAEVSIYANIDASSEKSYGIKSSIIFRQEESPEHINLDTDIRNDSLKVIAQNVYKEKMPQHLSNNITGVWKCVEYQTLDFFHLPYNVNTIRDGSFQYDDTHQNSVSVYTRRVCEVDSIPSRFQNSFFDSPKCNVKGIYSERYYTLDDIGRHKSAETGSNNKSPITTPIKWYSKGDISQFSYSFYPYLYDKDVSLWWFKLNFGKPVSVSVCSPVPDFSNEFGIEYTDSTKLDEIAKNGLYARVELVDNVNLQSYRLYILGAILSILISLAFTLLYSILKSYGFKYSLVFLIIPTILGILLMISPLRNHVALLDNCIYFLWIAYILLLMFLNREKAKTIFTTWRLSRYEVGLLLSFVCMRFLAYYLNILIV